MENVSYLNYNSMFSEFIDITTSFGIILSSCVVLSCVGLYCTASKDDK